MDFFSSSLVPERVEIATQRSLFIEYQKRNPSTHLRCCNVSSDADMFEPNMGIKNDLRWCIGVELDKVIILFALITVSRRTVIVGVHPWD